MKLRKSKRKIFQPIALIVDFIRLESSSGIILFMAAICAMLLANSPWQSVYHAIVNTALSGQLQLGGAWHYHISLISTTNEALMAVFFLLVGLEIKREIYVGELNSFAKVVLPGVAALGGMVVPALIYGAGYF
jgi:NhaA family Na+:H+ antiporter